MTNGWLAAFVLLQYAGATEQDEHRTATSTNAVETRHVRVFWADEARDSPVSPCVNKQRVRAGVAATLARPVFASEREGDVRLLTRVTPGQKAVRLTLTDPAGAPLGTRQLRANSCSELTELVTFTLSVMLDFRIAELPTKRALANADSPDTDSPSDTAPTVNDSAEPDPRTATAPDTLSGDTPAVVPDGAAPPRARVPMQMALRAGGKAIAGLSPTPLWGGYLGFGLEVAGSWSLNLGLAHTRGAAVSRQGGQLRATRSELEMSICQRVLDSRPFRADACLGVAPGMLRVSASGYASNLGSDGWNVLLNPSLQVSAPVGTAVALVARAAVMVPVVRYDWTAARENQTVTLYEAPPLALGAWLGCQVALD